MKIKLISIALLFAGSAYAVDNPFSSLTALGNNLASGDLFAVTDVSDTTQSANGTTKKILASDVGLFYISDTVYNQGTWDADLTHAASKNALRDYFSLFDTDGDGKVDVLDNIAAAGIPYTNSSGAVQGVRTMTSGTGITVTNGDASAGNPTFAINTTTVEATTWGGGANASNIWTFNLSGTDPVITFSSGTVNISTGALQIGGVNVSTDSGTASWTNKTFDASATGNVLKMKGLPQFSSPDLVGAGVTIGTTATTFGYGKVNYSNSLAVATNWAEYYFIVPADWDTAVDPTVKISTYLTGADTGTQQYTLSVLDVTSSAQASGAPGTPINVNQAADASGASGDVENTGPTTLTGWGTLMTAGHLMKVRVARGGDVATFDTSTVNSILISLELSYGVTQ